MDQELIDKLHIKVQSCTTAEEALDGYAIAPDGSTAQKSYLMRIRELVNPELIAKANSFNTAHDAWEEYACTPFDGGLRSPSSNLPCVIMFERWNDLDHAEAGVAAAKCEDARTAWVYYEDAYSGSNAEVAFLARYNELNMSEAIASAAVCVTADEALEQYGYCEPDDPAKCVFENRWLELHLAV